MHVTMCAWVGAACVSSEGMGGGDPGMGGGGGRSLIALRVDGARNCLRTGLFPAARHALFDWAE